MATATENMIVGLDIGTSKVVAIVGQTAADGTLEIVGLGSVSYTHLTLPTSG